MLVPQENQKDVEEISREIRNGLEIIPVKTMEDVTAQAFVPRKSENAS